MPARLPLRYTIPGVILVVGATLLLFDYLYERRRQDERLHRDSESELRVLAASAAGELEAAFRQDRSTRVGATFERLGGNRLIDLAAFVDHGGRIVWSTEARLEDLAVVETGALGLGAILRDARQERQVVMRHEADPPGVMGAFPVQMRGETRAFLPEATGWLLVHYDLAARRNELYQELRGHTLSYAVVLSLLCVALWLLFRHALLARVQRLMLATRSIAKGEYNVELDIAGSDEIAELAGDFRVMAGALQRHSEQIGFLSRHDPLTGLLNRPGLETVLEDAILSARQDGPHSVLCYVDIDGFRVINDTQGHAAGDELLQRIARLLTEGLPRAAAIARLASDEFAVILPLTGDQGVRARAEEVQTLLADLRFAWGEENYQVRFNIGVMPIQEAAIDAERALSLADAACYAAKESPHERIRIWRPGDPGLEVRHGQMHWVSRIQSALDENRFVLYAQEILPAAGRTRNLHLEVLVRMLDSRGVPILPGRFLPAAERYRLIGQIDQWVIRNTFDRLAEHPERLDRIEMCSINLSGMSLDDPVVLELIAQGLEYTGGFPAHRICFEITETEAVTHLETAARFLKRLRALGCRFALDDFGSGVSSFGYLKSLDVDLIKIDGLFVRGVAHDPMDLAIVRSINDIAHEMGKLTVAEFVESREILHIVRRIGVDYVQGHAIGRAEPLSRFLERPLASSAHR
jgi:diguanylate cyclase (GGDEF)-like protein